MHAQYPCLQPLKHTSPSPPPSPHPHRSPSPPMSGSCLTRPTSPSPSASGHSIHSSRNYSPSFATVTSEKPPITCCPPSVVPKNGAASAGAELEAGRVARPLEPNWRPAGWRVGWSRTGGRQGGALAGSQTARSRTARSLSARSQTARSRSARSRSARSQTDRHHMTTLPIPAWQASHDHPPDPRVTGVT